MTIAFVAIALLLLAAIAVQVRYAQMILRSGAQVNRTTKVVWGLNIGLLVAVLVVLGYFMLAGGM